MDKMKKLANGLEMPRLGLGVWRVNDDDATNSVKWAISNGYQLIDTAAVYKNEEGVGEGIRQAGVNRGDYLSPLSFGMPIKGMNLLIKRLMIV